jgi:hypothetical protein
MTLSFAVVHAMGRNVRFRMFVISREHVYSYLVLCYHVQVSYQVHLLYICTEVFDTSVLTNLMRYNFTLG